MSLEGTLGTFSAADVCQLMAATKKSGALRLWREAAQGVVYFAHGSVTGSTNDVRSSPLGRRLLALGLVDAGTLAWALREAHDGGLGRALLAAGAVDDGALHAVASELTVDAACDLLSWSTGSFRLAADEPNPDDVGVSLPVEAVVGEARQRLAEWSHLQRWVASVHSVVTPAAQPPVDEVTLAAQEWRLVALADGRRTVAELAELAGRGEFTVARTLAGLAERGLVRIREQPGWSVGPAAHPVSWAGGSSALPDVSVGRSLVLPLAPGRST